MVAAKKPLTPFFSFCAIEREKNAKKTDTKLSAKQLGEMWRDLGEHGRNIYKEAYMEEKEKWDNQEEEKKEGRKRGRSKSKAARDESASKSKPKGKKTNHQEKKNKK